MKYEETFIKGNALPRPLTGIEIYTLYEKMQNGDKKAREQIIEHNIRLVLKIVRKYDNYDYISKDLTSIGLIGLIKGVDTFDTHKNNQFSTYVSVCINNEILYYLRSNKREFDSIKFEDIVPSKNYENKMTYENFLYDEEAEKSLLAFEEQDFIKFIRKIIASLSDDERILIEKRYGFIDDKVMTQTQLAKELGVNQSCLSRKEQKILKKLKILLNKNDNGLSNKEDIVVLNNKLPSQIDNKKVVKKRKCKRDYTNIYTYFNEYDKKIVDEVLEKTNESYIQTLHIVWGENLDELNEEALTPEIRKSLISIITPNLRKRLNKQTIEWNTNSLSILDEEVIVNRMNVLDQCNIEIKSEYKVKQKISKERQFV